MPRHTSLTKAEGLSKQKKTRLGSMWMDRIQFVLSKAKKATVFESLSNARR